TGHRGENAEYARLRHDALRLERAGDPEGAARLRQQRRHLPSVDPSDPDFRRLSYVRYADDFLLGCLGPKREAEEIKQRLGEYLSEHLRLTLSDTKTLITHGRTGAARFLGYEVTVHHNDTKLHPADHRRSVNGKVGLKVPYDVVTAKCRRYLQGNKP